MVEFLYIINVYFNQLEKNTVETGYKKTLGSRKIYSHNRYKLYSRYENLFQMVLISGMFWYQIFL